MAPPANVVVRMPNWVGDVVMATPALRAIRASWPGARVTLLIRPRLTAILEGLPWFDDVIPCGPRGPLGYLALAGKIRRRRFDLALVLPNSFNAAFLMWLARVPRRVGYALEGRSFLLTEAVPVEMEGWKRRPTYMGDYYAELCVRAGCRRGPEHLELAVSPEARKAAEEILSRLGVARDAEIVGLCPGASFGSSKLWPAERFAALGDALALGRHAAIVIFHGPGEEELAGRIQKLMRSGAPVVCRDFSTFKALVERCSLLVGTDSGHRHFGVALGVPVVVLMGPTRRAYTDGNLDNQRILQKEVPCGPCQRKKCPTGDHRCMLAITVEEVAAAANEILDARSARAGRP